jgi:phage terminase Nu1 subunit (DNA packaging protein)
MKWTVHKASIEWGVDRRSLAKWLSQLGLEVTAGKKFHTRDISRAIMGDLDYERTRDTRAAASIRELELAQKREELVSMPEAQAMYTAALLPVRQRLMAMPSECCTRANPTDPLFAQAALQQWVDAALPTIREKLPRPTVGKRSTKEG